MTDFEKGREAFLNDFDYLYLTGSEDFREGYRDAWWNMHRYTLENDLSGHCEEDAWSQQLQTINESAKALDAQMERDLAELSQEAREKAQASITAAIVSAYALGCLTVWVILGVAK